VVRNLKKEEELASETSSLLKSFEDGQSPKNEIFSVSHAPTSKPCSVKFVCRGNFFPNFSFRILLQRWP